MDPEINNDFIQYFLDGRHFSIVPTKMTDYTATRIDHIFNNNKLVY